MLPVLLTLYTDDGDVEDQATNEYLEFLEKQVRTFC